MDTMIADTIPLSGKTNEERGFPADSYYIITFADGSKRDERDTNWSEFSEVKEIEYFNGVKQVSVCKLPVLSIEVHHGNLETTLDVPEGCELYNAFYSEATFVPSGRRYDNLNGRIVGLVKDGKVIEERFLNARQGEVMGIRP